MIAASSPIFKKIEPRACGLRGIVGSLAELTRRPVSPARAAVVTALPAPLSPGLLLSFEGVDGSGKSTQARLLADRLEAAGHDALLLREPGGTPLSERVRSILLDATLGVEPYAELLLFSAARAQLVRERIRPALAAGTVVLLDRFYDSTVAYQGAGRGVAEPGWLADFNRRVTDGLTPRRTYLVALSPEKAAERRGGRAAADRMEAAGEAFYARVGEAYDRLAEAEPERVLRLDGTRTIEALHETVWEDVQQLLAASSPGTPA